MSAMETMLANMIGLKPGEMKEMAERIQHGFLEIAATMKRTEDNTVAILALLEEQNARGKFITDDRDSRNAGAAN